MVTFYWVGGAVAALLFLYLVMAMLAPERLQ